jgi:flagellar biosynthesis protein
MDVKSNSKQDGLARSRAKYAAAIRYTPGVDNSPVILAAGQGQIAETIMKLAEEAGIPNHVEPALAKILAKLEPGTPIPEETYQLVAQILAFIWRLDKNYSPKREA